MKVTYIVLALLCSLTLVACSSQTDTAKSSVDNAAPAAPDVNLQPTVAQVDSNFIQSTGDVTEDFVAIEAELDRLSVENDFSSFTEDDLVRE